MEKFNRSDLISTIISTTQASYIHKTNVTNSDYIRVSEIQRKLKIACDFLAIITLVIIMLSMGADITLAQILAHIKKPIGVTIGMVSQFVIMPLSAYALLLIVKESGLHAMGLLIIACCPGGALSNVFAYFVDGDLSLSVTMTTISTILAMGMMPLNLWIYGRSFENKTVVIPYKSIAISLAMVTSPVLVGLFIRHLKPRIAVFVTKIGSFLGTILLVTIIVLNFLMYPFIFYTLTVKMYCVLFLLPFVGILFGFLFAMIFRQSIAICKVIAIESGIQNTPTALGVIALSFKKEFQKDLNVMALLYAIGMIVICFILLIIYRIYKLCTTTKSFNLENKEYSVK